MDANEQQGRNPRAQYVIKCPRALQWFENGRLYKAGLEERQAGRFELFLDLLCAYLYANSIQT